MSELEDFLRRAAAKRKERSIQQPKILRPQNERDVRSRERVTTNDLEDLDEIILEPEIVHEVEVIAAATQQQEGQQLGSRSLGQLENRRMRVGKSVDQADERMDQHLHDAFDHDLSDLDDRHLRGGQVTEDEFKKTGDATSSNLIQDVLEMLSSSDSASKAFLLSEILKRKF